MNEAPPTQRARFNDGVDDFWKLGLVMTKQQQSPQQSCTNPPQTWEKLPEGRAAALHHKVNE